MWTSLGPPRQHGGDTYMGTISLPCLFGNVPFLFYILERNRCSLRVSPIHVRLPALAWQITSRRVLDPIAGDKLFNIA